MLEFIGMSKTDGIITLTFEEHGDFATIIDVKLEINKIAIKSNKDLTALPTVGTNLVEILVDRRK